MAVSCEETNRAPGQQRTSFRSRIDLERQRWRGLRAKIKQTGERTQNSGSWKADLTLLPRNLLGQTHPGKLHSLKERQSLSLCSSLFSQDPNNPPEPMVWDICHPCSLLVLTPDPVVTNLLSQTGGSCSFYLQKAPEEQLSLCQLSAEGCLTWNQFLH